MSTYLPDDDEIRRGPVSFSSRHDPVKCVPEQSKSGVVLYGYFRVIWVTCLLLLTVSASTTSRKHCQSRWVDSALPRSEPQVHTYLYPPRENRGATPKGLTEGQVDGRYIESRVSCSDCTGCQAYPW